MLLTSRDIATLNRARAVLKRVEQAAWRRSLSHYDPFAPVTAWDLGRVSEAASAADDAIFHVLATARANCHVKLTDAQLFGPEPVQEGVADAVREPEPVVPDAAPETDPTPSADDDAAPERRPGLALAPRDDQPTGTPHRPVHAV